MLGTALRPSCLSSTLQDRCGHLWQAFWKNTVRAAHCPYSPIFVAGQGCWILFHALEFDSPSLSPILLTYKKREPDEVIASHLLAQLSLPLLCSSWLLWRSASPASQVHMLGEVTGRARVTGVRKGQRAGRRAGRAATEKGPTW